MLDAAIVILAFLALVVQSTLAHITAIDMILPSLSLPIVLYMGLHNYNAARGALLSLTIGYMMDVFAGSPMGLYTFTAVVIFLVSRVAALRLFLHGWIFEMILTFFLTLISSLIVISIRAMFEKDFGDLLMQLKIVSSRAGATAVAAPAVFRMMAWMEKATPHPRGERRVGRT